MSRTPRLAELIKTLERLVQAEASPVTINPVVEEIVRLIRRKRNRFENRYNINLPHWDDSLRASPEQLATFLSNPDFAAILKRDVDITFLNVQKHRNIYSPLLNDVLENVRNKGRIIFENPFLVLDNHKMVIQSWARAKSISKKYKRHLPTSRAPDKSKFLRGMLIEDIEYELFSSAPGILETHKVMFMYGYFDSDIGILPSRESTRYVKMQCDRNPRETERKGFFTEIHSYPVSEREVLDELRPCSNLLELLHQRPLAKAEYSS